MEEKEIHCSCGKLLAKRHSDGKIYVWCKECRKEVELEIDPYGPMGKNKRFSSTRREESTD